MDYSRLRVLMTQRNFNDKKLSELVGVSDTGLRQMMNRATMRIDVLEKISEVLEVPIIYFFQDDQDAKKYTVKKCFECEKLKGKIEVLKELLDKKDQELKKFYEKNGKK